MNVTPFDLTGPLPTGTTLLEASAGTGKTYTVGALVTRALAEGVVTMDQLLVITFTRAASQELRERVRGQLVAAQAALGEPSLATDDFLRFLVAVDGAERERRRARLGDALAGFDAATISTTHQFCQQVLKSLGVAGDLDPGVQLVESLDDLVEEVVDDLYLAKFGWAEAKPPFNRDAGLEIGRAVMGDPHAAIAGAPAGAMDPNASVSVRVDFGAHVRREVERRKRRLGILSYDDLLSRLAEALVPAEQGDGVPLAKVRMAHRWKMVLVDEFQDTDPVQWQVLERAFGGETTMILIGDPKQAIYAFRGGDIVAYLRASRTATTKATLAKNHRSDPELVRQLGQVFDGAALGDAEIVAHPSDPALTGSRLVGAPAPGPLRIRVVDRNSGVKATNKGDLVAGAARNFVAQDCAGDIARLLNSGACFGVGEQQRPLVAADLAILVATRDHGTLVAQALAERGIHSVVAGAGQVMRTKAAEDWLTLLNALEQPSSSGRARAVALTPFFGKTRADLDQGGDALTDALCEDLRELAVLARTRGIAGLFAELDQRGVSQRTLAAPGGIRQVTDLRHLAETLHDHAVRDGLGLAAITAWMRAERRTAIANNERTRRLDTDAAAVQILTIHAAKGLQFPVVYLPFAFDNYRHDITVTSFHDAAGQRMIGIDPGAVDRREQVARHAAEEAGEELRTLYVALTRGQSQVVTWWAPSSNVVTSALHRLLIGRAPGSPEVPAATQNCTDEQAWAKLTEWAQRGAFALERAGLSDEVYQPPAVDAAALGVRKFARPLDLGWRRTSYSGLIRAEQHSAGVASEAAELGKDDEDSGVPDELAASGVAAATVGVETLALDSPSPMAELPVGATFGSLVHAILEHVDPAAPQLSAALAEVAEEQLRWWPVEATPTALGQALAPVLHTPLGPLAGNATLAELGDANRLCELDFEFPLAGGDSPVGDVWLGQLADLLEQELTAADPIRPYAARLRAPALAKQPLRGYLSGSIDVVLRTAQGKFLVVDYKTNRLGDPGQPMVVGDYSAQAMADAMTHSHYPLQALLYAVVLHRYLRWRLPDYDPEQHFGGVLYLYVRGMAGPGTPVLDGTPCGVFAWQPPTRLLEVMSDWLAGVECN